MAPCWFFAIGGASLHFPSGTTTDFAHVEVSQSHIHIGLAQGGYVLYQIRKNYLISERLLHSIYQKMELFYNLL